MVKSDTLASFQANFIMLSRASLAALSGLSSLSSPAPSVLEMRCDRLEMSTGGRNDNACSQIAVGIPSRLGVFGGASSWIAEALSGDIFPASSALARGGGAEEDDDVDMIIKCVTIIAPCSISKAQGRN